MAAPTIPSLTNLPSKGDPSTFHARADALWTQINNLATALNALSAYYETFQFPSLATYGIGITTTQAVDIGNIDKVDTPAGINKFTPTTTGTLPVAASSGIVITSRFSASNMGQLAWRNGLEKIVYFRRYDVGAWESWTRLNVEYGANANGTYARYPDGTQICYCVPATAIDCTTASGAGFTSAIQTITFPATFTTTFSVIVSANVQGDLGRWATGKAISTTQGQVQQKSFTSAAPLLPTHCTAIGKWY